MISLGSATFNKVLIHYSIGVLSDYEYRSVTKNENSSLISMFCLFYGSGDTYELSISDEDYGLINEIIYVNYSTPNSILQVYCNKRISDNIQNIFDLSYIKLDKDMIIRHEYEKDISIFTSRLDLRSVTCFQIIESLKLTEGIYRIESKIPISDQRFSFHIRIYNNNIYVSKEATSYWQLIETLLINKILENEKIKRDI